MTIQRQYTLANCKLVVEGWEDAVDPAAPPAIRPMVSIVTHVECHFSGVEKPLSGGQELLTNLVQTVSRYVQQVLSGVEHPVPSATQTTARVQMQSVEGDRHRLIVNQAGSGSDPSKYQVDLSTTQLFDLVEVVDQLVADGQTLPQLSVDLSPVPKRFVATQEPVTEKLLPATLGVSSLAVAAIALFLIPAPKVERPEVDSRPAIEEQAPESSSSGPGGPEPGIGITPEGDADEANPDASSSVTETQPLEDGEAIADGEDDVTPSDSDPDASETEDTATEADAPDPSDTAEVDIPDLADGEADSAATLPDTDEVDDLLRSAQPIADPDQLADLTRLLRDRIDQVWDRPETLTQNFVYRVGVSEVGELVGFTVVDDQGFDDPADNPLTRLETAPVSVGDVERPVGQFRVVFRTTGVVEVSPWYGRLPE